MKLIFIGFMGSGKSSVAKALAVKLNLQLIEMDKEIEKKAGKKIAEIFSTQGEVTFRQMEIDLAKELRTSDNVVISSGGGVVMNKIILDYLREQDGKVIFLNTSFAALSERLKNDSSRPLFQDKQKAKELYDFRIPLYKKYADIIIETDNKTIEEISETLLKLI